MIAPAPKPGANKRQFYEQLQEPRMGALLHATHRMECELEMGTLPTSSLPSFKLREIAEFSSLWDHNDTQKHDQIREKLCAPQPTGAVLPPATPLHVLKYIW